LPPPSATGGSPSKEESVSEDPADAAGGALEMQQTKPPEGSAAAATALPASRAEEEKSAAQKAKPAAENSAGNASSTSSSPEITSPAVTPSRAEEEKSAAQKAKPAAVNSAGDATSTSSSSSPEISTPAVTHLDRHNGEEADDFEEDFVTVNNNEYEAEETENSPGRFTWVEEETKVSLPQSFRKTDQEKVHIRYLPAFGADQLMLVDLSWAGDEVYEKLRNHSEIKKFWKAVTNHRKLGNLNRDKGMYYIGVEGSFDFGDSDFQRAFLTVVDKLLVEYAGKPKNDVFQEVDLTKQEIPASLLFTVFESQQPPHVDVRDKSHKQLTSRAKVSVLPWSGILPLTSGGSKLVYYGPDHPAKLRKIPVLIDIPAMHALLFK
jgi:hypothetical protein